MPSAIDAYDLECMAEDATWGVALDGIPIINVGDLLSLIITQINYDFICLYLFWVVL